MSKEDKMSKETKYRTRQEAKAKELKRRTKNRRVTRTSIGSAIIVGISVVLFVSIYSELRAVDPLPIAATTSALPINETDLLSGKPVKAGSPTMLYKGYKIGFCCDESTSKWETLSEAEKDKLVRPFSNHPVTGLYANPFQALWQRLFGGV
jgi:hypothetical protein